jgi:hypothetical protein
MLKHSQEIIYKHPFYSMESFPGVDGTTYLILTSTGCIHEATFAQNGTFRVDGCPNPISIKNVCGWALGSKD